MSALLELEHLRVTLPAEEGATAVLRDVSLQVGAGEAVGLVGASGSGKTMTARAVVRLLPPGAQVGGSIRFAGRSVLDLDREQLLRYRADDVAMVFQDPRSHINPVRRIGDFLTEALVLTQGMRRTAALAKVTRLLGETGVEEPERRLRQYPHELSGGQLQRVMIAAALACEPRLLIADEPTTALDVTTQSEVMAMLDEVRHARGLALLFITHDLDLAAAVCERTVVMRAGAIVDEQPVARADLLQQTAPASSTSAPASSTSAPAFFTSARASSTSAPACSTSAPEPAVLEVSGLCMVFAGLLAVDDVSFAVAPGASLAIVGESGSGKTTIARMIVGLQAPSAGAIAVLGHLRSRPPRGARERRTRGREAQIVFQDNYSSLDPRQRVGDALGEALDLHFRPTAEERRRRVAELLDSVGLKQEHARALPRALSGGERQRAALARALAVQPRLLVLDEAVSSLDVATQAQILDLLAGIRVATGTSYVFISHDLAVVRRVSDEVIVLRRGRIVERGATQQILTSPADPYTRLLLDSVPRPGWKPRRRAQ
ncbi:MAG TPA: ABC transporter ATP-binding protein [Solirubrobacteraceae bacterium]|jgi:peptide/nickel transport system ATP-binding protein|nr:ABC transporter ATP-binding protein [Solirubrobacteraceae bacterium]